MRFWRPTRGWSGRASRRMWRERRSPRRWPWPVVSRRCGRRSTGPARRGCGGSGRRGCAGCPLTRGRSGRRGVCRRAGRRCWRSIRRRGGRCGCRRVWRCTPVLGCPRRRTGTRWCSRSSCVLGVGGRRCGRMLRRIWCSGCRIAGITWSRSRSAGAGGWCGWWSGRWASRRG